MKNLRGTQLGKQILLHSVILFSLLVGISSCKENTILPPDLVPAVDGINTFQEDTFTVITTTVRKDSLLTGGKLNGVDRGADAEYSQAIGTISAGANGDEVFGKTVASVYVQVRPPSPAFTFSGTNRVFDSVVLATNYISSFGDTSSNSQVQRFDLFQSSENKELSDAFYETETVSLNGSAIASTMVDFSTIRTDSPVISGVTLRPQIRFNLQGTSFQNDFINQTATTAFKDYNTFLDWLGGFYITPDENAGNTLGYFDTDNTSMYVYYRFDNDQNERDTAVVIFPFDPAFCVRFNAIERDYQGTPSDDFIETGAAAGDSLVFIQGEPGLAGLITFPQIGKFPNAIINKAELTLTVVSPFTNFLDTASYTMPGQLQIVYVNELGEDEVLEDYIRLGARRVGGLRNWATLSGSQRIQYKFNISHTIQEAVTTQNSNFALKLSGARSNFPAQNRVVIRGSGSSVQLEKPNLNIIFTKIQ
jgi:hypothetical protein